MRGETTAQGQCVGPFQLLVNMPLCYCATGRSRLAADGAWQRLFCGGTRATAFNACVVLGYCSPCTSDCCCICCGCLSPCHVTCTARPNKNRDTTLETRPNETAAPLPPSTSAVVSELYSKRLTCDCPVQSCRQSTVQQPAPATL